MTTEKEIVRRVLTTALAQAKDDLRDYVGENNFDGDDSPDYDEMGGYLKVTARLQEKIHVFEQLLKTR